MQSENANSTRKERSNMVKARIAARLTQKDVAKILKVNIASIVNWEKAHTTPQLYQIADLREAIKFTGTDEELLQVFVVGRPIEDTRDTEGTDLERTPLSEVPEEREITHTNKMSLLHEDREKRGWTRAKVEALTEGRVTVPSLERWEKGKSWPRHDGLLEICRLYNKTPQELGLDKGNLTGEKTDAAPVLPPCQTEPTRDILESSDSHLDIPESEEELLLMDQLRRNISTAIVSGIAVPININFQLLTGPVIDPEDHLEESEIIIKECWQLVNTWQFGTAKALLNADRRILTKLATTPFCHQRLAASLAFEAEIMQIMIATHELNYAAREKHCAKAVQFGVLSGNWDVLTIAHGWQGNTYTYCYRQPKRAITIFNDALSDLNSKEHIQEISPLNRSDLYIQLAIAYARDGKESEALKYVELARMTIPDNPELDPFYRYIRTGHAELDEFEGRAHLYLAEYLSSSDHAQTSYKIFEKSISKQPQNRGNRGRALTRRADAARVLGDMKGLVEDLTDGLHISVEIDSLKQMSEADDVLHRVPERWQKEKAIQNLQKDVSRALVVARR